MQDPDRSFGDNTITGGGRAGLVPPVHNERGVGTTTAFTQQSVEVESPTAQRRLL